jgi:putative RNA 2'-phosphotransferase
MTDQKQNRTLAKVIAYMLGKAPEEFGLIPDRDGFVKIKELLQALHDEDGWRYVRPATLNELAITLPDVPFEIIDNRIRSRQKTRLPDAVTTQVLPRCLYTCIRQRAYAHVLQEGIAPTTSDRVVLCSDKEMAEKIGNRRSPDPVTLTIHTDKAEDQGIQFDPVGEGLYLADYIPAGCFSGPALPREKEKKQTKTRSVKPDDRPADGTHNRAGTFLISPPPAVSQESSRTGKKNKETDWKRERKRRSRGGHQQWPDD